jgi:hypothetical protein
VQHCGSLHISKGEGKEILMRNFEYDITKHPAKDFNRLTYFCTEAGECSVEEVPDGQVKKLRQIPNAKGDEGWELVQMGFGRDGIIAMWKRAKDG